MPQNHLEEHITNEEVKRRAGVALLPDMVSDRKTAKRTTSKCGNVQRVAREREGGQRCGDICLRKT